MVMIWSPEQLLWVEVEIGTAGKLDKVEEDLHIGGVGIRRLSGY